MHSSSSDRSDGSSDLLIELIETLEACGLKHDAYQLHDYVDVEALQQLRASSDGDIVVQFTIEGIQLRVSPEGVDVLVEDQSDPSEE